MEVVVSRSRGGFGSSRMQCHIGHLDEKRPNRAFGPRASNSRGQEWYADNGAPIQFHQSMRNLEASSP
jgi:hypothetical protein